MAFACYTGVQMQTNDIESTAIGPEGVETPFQEAQKTDIPLICTGGVRQMLWPGAQYYNKTAPIGTRVTRHRRAAERLKSGAAEHGQPLFIVGMIHFAGLNWFSETTADYANRARDFAREIPCDIWELGNEPPVPPDGNAATLTGPYFPKLVAASNAVREVSNKPIYMAAPFPGGTHRQAWTNFNQYCINNGLTVTDIIDGIAVHPYTWTGGVASVDVMQAARTHVNALSGAGSWAGLHMMSTECGYTVKSPKYPGQVMAAGNEAGNAGARTVSQELLKFFQECRDNRETLKLRFAGYFVWCDYSSQGELGAAFMGLKKLTSWSVSMASPPTPPYTTKYYGGAQDTGRPFRPAYTVLRDNAQIGRGYDLSVTPDPQPTVTYLFPAVTGITQTSAGLHGAVNPNGTTASRFFQWGQTTAYGNSSPPVSSGSGSAAIDAHYAIPAGSLLPNTTYHFRLQATNNGGTTFGADRQFTTLAALSAPTVTTGPVTNPTSTTATLNGVINPNSSAVTDYHFEYGLTTAYGTSTTVSTLANGTANVNVSANLIDLTAGATYHYRLVATNGQGTTNGLDASFTVSAPPTASSPDLVALTVLSIQLSVEITTADGRSFRWDPDDAEAANRPQSLTFSSQAGDGFAEASCQLPRGVGFDWPDLHLLDRFRLIGADGSIAYEGRVAGTPRKVDSEGEAIEVQAQGLMSSSRDQMFTRIIVDRSGERWEPPSLALRKAIYTVGTPLDADWTATSDSGSLMFKGGTLKRMSVGSQAVLEYIAPTGEKLSAFQYTGAQKLFTPSDDQSPELHATDDDSAEMGTWDKKPLTLDGTGVIQTAALDTPRRYLGLRARTVTAHGSGDDTAPGPSPVSPALRRYDKIAVYGNHTIEPRPNGEDPDGVYASDVITWLIEHYCPLLNADRVSQTAVPIAHLVFDTPTTPFDAFTLVNGFHLWSLGAWENGTVEYAPADLRSTDWQVRSDDPGVTLDLQGDAVDGFANGIIVSYTDIDSRQVNLFPTAYEDLRDEDPDNPANKQGIQLWTSLDISNPVDTRGALSLGRVALREFNRPKAPGVVTATLGYIEDGQGNLQPGWKVRAGHTLSIGNLPNDSPRLITATQWGEDGTLSMTLEQPPTRIDAVLARLEMGAEGRQTRRPALGRSDR